jgi:hypothetical protein
VRPVIAQQGLNRRAVTAKEFKDVLGERIFEAAMNEARIMYIHVAEVRKNLLTLHGEVFAVAKKLCPDAKFVKLAP